MKWFFALSEASLHHRDHDWIALIHTAVASAKQRTTLVPHFIFDGAEGELTRTLTSLGVQVIHHRIKVYDRMLARRALLGPEKDPMYMAVAAGAFLRTEIPLIEHEDEFVLYTDCDVMFLQNPELNRFHPAFFACAPQRNKDDFEDMNSGVMIMNLPALRDTLSQFQDFTVEHFNRLNFDQDAYREFYSGRYEKLPLEYNWKPYWGHNPDARIVHFHGPKPLAIRKLIEDETYQAPQIWRELYVESTSAYQAYLSQWDGFQDR